MSLHCSLWCVHMHLNDATCIGVVLASSPGRFFQREGEGGKKRPGDEASVVLVLLYYYIASGNWREREGGKGVKKGGRRKERKREGESQHCMLNLLSCQVVP